MGTARLFSFICFLILCTSGYSQSHNASAYEHLINPKIQKEHILQLTGEETAGRGAGSRGGYVARMYIEQKLEEYSIEKRGIQYAQPFKKNSVTAYNIIGEIKSSYKSNEYVIIGAHYDHMGEIKGKIYPGADDNASGVAALLELARIFGQIKKDGAPISKNILFVAFDAKELSMAGSTYFINTLKIHPGNIKCMINLDQMGSILAPPNKDTNYILVLGREKLSEWAARQLDLCNKLAHLGLDIDYTFYNSEGFLKLFYKLSDHYPFAKKEIPALFFTSGITDHTYKESDTEETISYPVLTKRIKLIYHFVYHLIN